MRFIYSTFLLTFSLSIIISCDAKEKSNSMKLNPIMEVTTFKLKSGVSSSVFNTRDTAISSDYTSKQPGFIKRISGVTESGEIGVIVFWKSIIDADASMNKFMKDSSVADYADMIEASTMDLSRFTMDKDFTAEDSDFVEVMTFDLNDDSKIVKFDKVNKRVESDVTGTKPGFMQRLTGKNEEGKQAVAIFWNNKKNSDDALNPFMENPISQEFMGMMNQSTVWMGRFERLTALSNKLSKKDKVIELLNSFNTGDSKAISYINPKNYIQHNLSVADGLEGFGSVMEQAPPGGFKAEVVRAFEDANYVFTHTKYDFYGPKAGFDIFRFENDQIVEHWDNLSIIKSKTLSGRSQFDGISFITDLDKTEDNKNIIRDFYNTVLIEGDFSKFSNYFDGDAYIQHNTMLPDGVNGFLTGMKKMQENGVTMKINKLHMVLGEGNFVLGVSEGTLAGKPYAYYDLFRLDSGKIAEHWDVMSEIPEKSKWKNSNGKF